MNNLSVLLCFVFFPASGFARYWLVKRHDRRPITLHNEALQLIGGTGLFCLLAGCFIAFNIGDRGLWPLGGLVAGLVYDLALRWFFFEKEVYRICKTEHCRRDVAVERIRRRGGYGVAAFPRLKGVRSSHRRKVAAPKQAAVINQAW